MSPAERKTDDIVVLLFATGSNAARALYTALHIYRNCRMGDVRLRLIPPTETAFAYCVLLAPMVKLGML